MRALFKMKLNHDKLPGALRILLNCVACKGSWVTWVTWEREFAMAWVKKLRGSSKSRRFTKFWCGSISFWRGYKINVGLKFGVGINFAVGQNFGDGLKSGVILWNRL